MSSAFAWLNDLMRWIARWVPRIVLIPATHRGVLFGRAGRVLELEPGLCWYWPIVSELHKICTVERTMLNSAQLIGDGRLVAVVVNWRVRHAAQAVTTWRNLESRIDNESRAAVFAQDCDMGKVAEQMRETFAPAIEIISVLNSSDGAGFALKQFSEQAYRDGGDDNRDS